jgi:hypothetical protein
VEKKKKRKREANRCELWPASAGILYHSPFLHSSIHPIISYHRRHPSPAERLSLSGPFYQLRTWYWPLPCPSLAASRQLAFSAPRNPPGPEVLILICFDLGCTEVCISYVRLFYVVYPILGPTTLRTTQHWGLEVVEIATEGSGSTWQSSPPSTREGDSPRSALCCRAGLVLWYLLYVVTGRAQYRYCHCTSPGYLGSIRQIGEFGGTFLCPIHSTALPTTLQRYKYHYKHYHAPATQTPARPKHTREAASTNPKKPPSYRYLNPTAALPNPAWHRIPPSLPGALAGESRLAACVVRRPHSQSIRSKQISTAAATTDGLTLSPSLP